MLVAKIGTSACISVRGGAQLDLLVKGVRKHLMLFRLYIHR